MGGGGQAKTDFSGRGRIFTRRRISHAKQKEVVNGELLLLYGRSVAIKVHRPDIHDQITLDLEVLVDLAGFLDRHNEH